MITKLMMWLPVAYYAFCTLCEFFSPESNLGMVGMHLVSIWAYWLLANGAQDWLSARQSS